jgi:hypothetical protein
VVDKNARIADGGRILDPQGRVLKDYTGRGLPGYLEFEAPNEAAYFTLEVEGNRIHQGLSDRASVPASQLASAAPPPPPPPPPSAAPPKPAPPVETKPAAPANPEQPETWRKLDLQFNEQKPEVDIAQEEDEK